MTALNLILSFVAVAAVAGVSLLGFFVGHEAETAWLDADEHDRELDLAA